MKKYFIDSIIVFCSFFSYAQWEGDIRLTNNSAESKTTYNYARSIAASGDTLHVVWCDDRDGNEEIYYKNNPTGNPVGIKIFEPEIPKEYSLLQNYPNPFNPITKIKYSIPFVQTGHAQSVKPQVYDILGREVVTLVNEEQKPGTYEVEFNGSNLTSGIYFNRIVSYSNQLKTKNYVETKKIILLK